MSNPMMNAPPRPKEPDCLACRLTGAAAFTGLGGYAIYEAKRQGTFLRTRPPGSPFMAGKIQAVIGVALGLAAWSCLDHSTILSSTPDLKLATPMRSSVQERSIGEMADKTKCGRIRSPP